MARIPFLTALNRWLTDDDALEGDLPANLRDAADVYSRDEIDEALGDKADAADLGTMAAQNATGVAITGGAITGITDLAIADGGTGASNAANARSNLGLGSIATQAADNIAVTGGSVTGTTINASSNTISNLATSMFAANVIDTDSTFAANSDTRIATQKAVKAAVDLKADSLCTPFIAERTLGEKAGEVISLRDVGTPTTSGGEPDYTSVLVNNQGSLDYKTLEITEPVIRLDGCALSGVTNLNLRGKGQTQTTIRIPGSDDGLIIDDGGFAILEDFTILRGTGSTGGRGIVFTGTSSSMVLRGLLVKGHLDGGVKFEGESGDQQAENDVMDCSFIDNGGHQLHFVYSNDYMVHNNRFGRQEAVGYADSGCKVENSNAGQYQGNYHWNNVNCAIFDGASYTRVIGNRYEEARRDGVLITGGQHNIFTSNQIHTCSQETTGTYSALKLDDTDYLTAALNQMFSWDSGTYQFKYCVESINACDHLTLLGNSYRHYATSAVSHTGATNLTNVLNDPTTTILSTRTEGNVLDTAFAVDNPSTTSYAQLQAIFRVAGANRVVFVGGRDALTSGGEFYLKVADSSGTLQNRIIIDSSGRTRLTLPTSSAGVPSGYLWNDGGTVKVVP